MTKFFTSILAAGGGLFLILATLLYFNRADTNDAISDARDARIQIEQIQFDKDFAKSSGNALAPERLKRDNERLASLQSIVDRADAQRVAARAKRQEVSKSLDEAITDWARTGGADNSGPGPLPAAIAGLILFLVAVTVRGFTRKPLAKGEKTGRIAAFLDRIVDLASALRPKVREAK